MQEPLLIVNADAMQATRVGDYLYRVEQPALAMGRVPGVRVVNISATSPFFEHLCLQADVLIVHLLTGIDLLPMLEERKKKNFCTIFEVPDNFMAFHSSVGVHTLFSDPVVTASAFQYIRLADAVQTPGPRLRERLLFVNNNIRVFENQVFAPGPKRVQSSGKISLGWAGSLGHLDDLKYIAPGIVELCKRHPHIHFHFMGNRTCFDELTAAIPEHQKRYSPTGTLDDYLRFLETLDIGVAPLLDTEYNHCRSDIKFVEYASRGVVPVLSSITPYRLHAKHGHNAFLFKTPEEFLSIAAMLAGDRELRSRIGDNAYDYVRAERLEHQHAPDRVLYYQSMCRERPAKSDCNIPLSATAPDSQAYIVLKPPAETTLLRGVNAEAAGDDPGARALYKEAAALDKDYYLPAFRLGYSALRTKERDAALFLEQAFAINPRSLRALLYLGNLYAEHDEQKALEYYIKALEISALFFPALERIAWLFERNSNPGKAKEFYNSALLVNPFSSNALLGLGRVYDSEASADKALRAYETAADLAPNSAEALYYLAHFYFNSGRYYQASIFCRRSLELNPQRTATLQLHKKLSALDTGGMPDVSLPGGQGK